MKTIGDLIENYGLKGLLDDFQIGLGKAVLIGEKFPSDNRYYSKQNEQEARTETKMFVGDSVGAYEQLMGILEVGITENYFKKLTTSTRVSFAFAPELLNHLFEEYYFEKYANLEAFHNALYLKMGALYFGKNYLNLVQYRAAQEKLEMLPLVFDQGEKSEQLQKNGIHVATFLVDVRENNTIGFSSESLQQFCEYLKNSLLALPADFESYKVRLAPFEFSGQPDKFQVFSRGLASYQEFSLNSQLVIREFFKKGYVFKCLSLEQEWFVYRDRQNSTHFIKEGTLTEDESAFALQMSGEKGFAKRITGESGIAVPRAKIFTNIAEAQMAFERFSNQAIVIKPQNQQDSLGIHVLQPPLNEKQYEKALNDVFTYSESILIEEWINSPSYRFYLIDGQVEAVMERIPAQIVGDGRSSIKNLISKKAAHALRQIPQVLFPIEMNTETNQTLEAYGVTEETILARTQQLILSATDSLIKGADTLDVTEDIDSSYIKVVRDFAEKIKVKNAAFDLLIPNLFQPITIEHPESALLLEVEAPFNLAQGMFPYIGKKRNLAEKIIK